MKKITLANVLDQDDRIVLSIRNNPLPSFYSKYMLSYGEYIFRIDTDDRDVDGNLTTSKEIVMPIIKIRADISMSGNDVTVKITRSILREDNSGTWEQYRIEDFQSVSVEIVDDPPEKSVDRSHLRLRGTLAH